jgi:hypothetical protein
MELRPALRTAELLERLAALSESGQVTKRGYLRPVAAARLIRDFLGEGRAAQPPAAVQKAFSDGVLAVADAIENRSGEYVFVDEWDVSAPVDAVFKAVSDATTYPQWWCTRTWKPTAPSPSVRLRGTTSRAGCRTS